MTDEAVIHVTIDPAFARLLQRQRDIQKVHMGGMPSQMDDEVLSAFIRDMTLALCAEAHEAMEETQWKPWARINPEIPIVVNRDKFKGELADVFIFLMNLMLAADLSMMELAQAVDAKQDINIQRQIENYDGRSTKCSKCGRATDDPAVKCYRAGKDIGGYVTTKDYCEMDR